MATPNTANAPDPNQDVPDELTLRSLAQEGTNQPAEPGTLEYKSVAQGQPGASAEDPFGDMVTGFQKEGLLDKPKAVMTPEEAALAADAMRAQDAGADIVVAEDLANKKGIDVNLPDSPNFPKKGKLVNWENDDKFVVLGKVGDSWEMFVLSADKLYGEHDDINPLLRNRVALLKSKAEASKTQADEIRAGLTSVLEDHQRGSEEVQKEAEAGSAAA